MEKEQLENIVDTLKDNQIEEVILVLKDRDIWFTSKNDPTYTEPSSYYTLDEYGCPTEKAMEDILKDCNDYVGDGALDFTEAIDMWIEKCLADGKLAYIDYLVTTYKTKPVVDNIEAYEVKLESKKQESEFANEDLLNGDIDIIFENKEIVKEAKLVKDIEKFGEETEYVDKKGNTLNVGDLIYLPDKGYHLLRYSDNGGYYLYRPSLGFRQGPTTSKNGELIYKYNEIADKPLSNPYLEENKLTKNTTNKKIKTCNIKTESVKTRLREENNKSLELIGQMLQQDDFDANSNEGKIVVKTSELFNKLSDKGFDVQVNFDNGDSQSTILLSKQGGSVNITINNANDPLKAYTSGSFEVNNDTLKVLEDVQDVLNELN